MALTTTTVSAAVGATDSSLTVASATGFAAGSFAYIDQECVLIAKSYVSGTTIPILRGQNGTKSAAHVSGTNITVGLGSDFANPANGGPVVGQQTQRARTLTSYSASGAITLPTPGSDAIAVLVGTSVRAMTLANPTKDQDGDILIVIGNGEAAHTVTNTSGFGGGSTGYTVFTFAAGAVNSIMVMAMNGLWIPLPSLIGGTATDITATIA